MKLTTTNNGNTSGSKTTPKPRRAVSAACFQKVTTQLAAARETIFAESKQALGAPERLLRLALNEAEALAWETTFPQLVFPLLATEKVQAVVAWSANQKAVRRSSPVFALTE